jgi:hypothetical protein
MKIEGFRKSDSAVASFTFSKPEDAYAANSNNGLIQNTEPISANQAAFRTSTSTF